MTTSKYALDRVAAIVFFITAVLLPFFFIPTMSVTVDMAKTLLLVVGVIVTFSLFLMHVVKKGEITLPYTKVLWAVLVIPAAFLVSALLSQNPHIALFGYNLEVGTWAFVTLGFVLMFLAAVLMRSRERSYYAYLGLFAGFGLITIMSFVRFFAGLGVLTFGGVFSQNVPTPVGSWTDLALYFGAAAVLCVIALEELSLRARGKWLLIAGLVISIFSLAVLNVPVVWMGLLIFAFVYLLYAFSFNAPTALTTERKISYGALATLLVSLLFVFNPVVSTTGAKLGDVLSQKFNVQNLQVSPSIQATYQATRPVIKDSPLFGSGPNTFDTDWLAHKPTAVNATVFWNAPFSYGIGLLTTFVATTGIVGAVLWLLFLVLYIMLGLRAIFVQSEDKIDRYLTTSSFLVSLFLWIEAFVTVPSKVMFGLAFLMSGLFLASASRSGIIAEKTIIFRNSSRLAFMAVLLLVAILVGNIAYAYAAVKQSVSVLYFDKASISAAKGDLEGARTYAVRAASLSGEDIYYSAVAQVDIARSNQILSDASSTPEQAKAKFQSALSEAIASSQAAAQARPENYANWIALGQLYESMVPAPLSVKGAYDSAKAAYEQAKVRNPESPEPYYLEARLEVENKNTTAARADIASALAKKSDYADAYYLLTQIEITDGNTKEAIKNAQTLAILQPQNPGVLFQLGLLEYTDTSYQAAADALAAALELSPGYANAKYYYGLVLNKLGRRDEAIAQFEDLLKTNPGNTDLAQIITNIKAGKDPLPKSSTTTTSKTTPPISDQSAPAPVR